eukprot:Gb_10570 [translate_table: standard]
MTSANGSSSAPTFQLYHNHSVCPEIESLWPSVYEHFPYFSRMDQHCNPCESVISPHVAKGPIVEAIDRNFPPLNASSQTLSTVRKSGYLRSRGPISAPEPRMRENHSLSERERRKCMNERLLALQSLLPPVMCPKNNRLIILEASRNYILMLLAQLQDLKNKKAMLICSEKRRSKMVTSSNLSGPISSAHQRSNFVFTPASYALEKSKVTLKMFDNVVVINVRTPNTHPSLANILDELESHDLDIINVCMLRSTTMVIQYFHAKCSHPLMLSMDSLKKSLEKLVF